MCIVDGMDGDNAGGMKAMRSEARLVPAGTPFGALNFLFLITPLQIKYLCFSKA